MKNIMTSLCLALFIISASVTITLNFRPLYYHDISALKIEETSGFSKNIIKKLITDPVITSDICILHHPDGYLSKIGTSFLMHMMNYFGISH